MNKEKLQKDILLERFGKIAKPVSKEYGNNEFFAPMFFDDEIWKEKDAEKQRDIIVSKKERLRDIPSSCYGFRSVFLDRIRKSKKKFFGVKDLKEIFDQSDGLTLGDFEDISSGSGIIAKTNEWYYKAMGEQAFTKEGEVPTRFSNDKYFYLANAKNFFERALKSDLDEYIVQRWGAGTNLSSVEAFLAGLEHIDRNKKIFPKTRYIFSDYSKESVEDAKENALKNKRLKRYIDQSILNFEVIDAMTPPEKYKGRVFYIESSYLYDSLPQTILAKVNGEFYNIFYRGYVDERADVILNDGEKVLPVDLAEALRTDDWKVINDLKLKSFDAVCGEIELKPINIDQIKYGKEIKELVRDLNNVRIPSIDVIMESLDKAMDCLVDDGYIQVFDISATAKINGKLRIWGSFSRYHGAVYTGVNFSLIESVIDKKVRVEYGGDYVSRVLKEDLMPLCDVVGIMRNFSDQARILFGIDKLKGYKDLKKLNDEIIKKFGYSEEGRKEFKNRLSKLKWLNWNGRLFKPKRANNYMDDLFASLMEHTSGRIDSIRSKNLWLSDNREDTKNQDFRKLLDKIGYKADDVVKAIFENRDEMYHSTAYYCMTVEE